VEEFERSRSLLQPSCLKIYKNKMGKLFALLLLSASAHAAQVTEVHSGDTLTLNDAGKSFTLHLANIDAPELDQPFGLASRKSLEELCKGKNISVERREKLPTGYVQGVITCDEIDASRAQLKRGMAWVLPHPDVDISFTAIQDFVWRDKTGLWSEADPIPPWEWVKRKK
jgi:endonuclease YncB( thermonuclease family)